MNFFLIEIDPSYPHDYLDDEHGNVGRFQNAWGVWRDEETTDYIQSNEQKRCNGDKTE